MYHPCLLCNPRFQGFEVRGFDVLNAEVDVLNPPLNYMLTILQENCRASVVHVHARYTRMYILHVCST